MSNNGEKKPTICIKINIAWIISFNTEP